MPMQGLERNAVFRHFHNLVETGSSFKKDLRAGKIVEIGIQKINPLSIEDLPLIASSKK